MVSSKSITVKRVTALTDSERARIIEVCDKAFGPEEPSIISLTGGNPSLRPLLFSAIINAGLHSGLVYIASDSAIDDGEPLMAMQVYMPPGVDLFSTEEQRALGFYDLFKALSAETKNWWTKDYPRDFGIFIESVWSKKEKVDSYYGNLVATDPLYQRRGLATAIIDEVYTKALEMGTTVAVCASTEPATKYYRSVGFDEKGRSKLSSPVGDLPVMMMVRQ